MTGGSILCAVLSFAAILWPIEPPRYTPATHEGSEPERNIRSHGSILEHEAKRSGVKCLAILYRLRRNFMQRSASVLLIGLGLACARPEVDPRARVPIPMPGVTLSDASAEYPHLTFPDGRSTPNDRCIVTERKLNTHLPPVWVNGVPIGFC